MPSDTLTMLHGDIARCWMRVSAPQGPVSFSTTVKVELADPDAEPDAGNDYHRLLSDGVNHIFANALYHVPFGYRVDWSVDVYTASVGVGPVERRQYIYPITQLSLGHEICLPRAVCINYKRRGMYRGRYRLGVMPVGPIGVADIQLAEDPDLIHDVAGNVGSAMMATAGGLTYAGVFTDTIVTLVIFFRKIAVDEGAATGHLPDYACEVDTVYTGHFWGTRVTRARNRVAVPT